mgnify:CR=1 FL=1
MNFGPKITPFLDRPNGNSGGVSKGTVYRLARCTFEDPREDSPSLISSQSNLYLLTKIKRPGTTFSF